MFGRKIYLLASGVLFLWETHESFGKANKRVPLGSKTFLLESEKKVWSNPSAWLALGKGSQVICSSGCALWRAGQKKLSIEPGATFIGYGKSVANQLVSFLR